MSERTTRRTTSAVVLGFAGCGPERVIRAIVAPWLQKRLALHDGGQP